MRRDFMWRDLVVVNLALTFCTYTTTENYANPRRHDGKAANDTGHDDPPKLVVVVSVGVGRDVCWEGREKAKVKSM